MIQASSQKKFKTITKILVLGLFIMLLVPIAITNVSSYSEWDQKDYDKIVNYCSHHANDIMASKNPINDLVSAGLISDHYKDKSCSDAKNEIEQRKSLWDLIHDYSSGN
jgi:hypothetical protein